MPPVLGVELLAAGVFDAVLVWSPPVLPALGVLDPALLVLEAPDGVLVEDSPPVPVPPPAVCEPVDDGGLDGVPDCPLPVLEPPVPVLDPEPPGFDEPEPGLVPSVPPLDPAPLVLGGPEDVLVPPLPALDPELLVPDEGGVVCSPPVLLPAPPLFVLVELGVPLGWSPPLPEGPLTETSTLGVVTPRLAFTLVPAPRSTPAAVWCRPWW